MNARLNEANIQYEVIVEDYQKVVDEENPSIEEIELLQRQSGKWNNFNLMVQSIQFFNQDVQHIYSIV